MDILFCVSNYFFPFRLAEPFRGVFVAVDDAVAGCGAGGVDAGAGLTAGLGTLFGDEGLCKRLMTKVAKTPLIMYMSHFGTRTRAR